MGTLTNLHDCPQTNHIKHTSKAYQAYRQGVLSMQDVQNIQRKHKTSKRTKQGNHGNQPMGGRPQPPQGWPKSLGVGPKGRKGEGGTHHGHFSF